MDWGRFAGISLSTELLLWGSEKPQVAGVEGTISVNQYRGRKNQQLVAF